MCAYGDAVKLKKKKKAKGLACLGSPPGTLQECYTHYGPQPTRDSWNQVRGLHKDLNKWTAYPFKKRENRKYHIYYIL